MRINTLKFAVSLFFAVLTLPACHIFNNNAGNRLPGLYENCRSPNQFEIFQFREDSTFVFEWRTGYLYGRTTGKWKARGNHVLLQSYARPHAFPALDSIAEKTTDSIKGIKVRVFEKRTRYELPFVRMILLKDKRHSYCTTGTKGTCRSKVSAIRKLLLLDLQYGSYIYQVKNTGSNVFHLFLEKSDDYYRYFENERWKIRDKQLLSPPVCGKSKPYRRYKKVKELKYQVY